MKGLNCARKLRLKRKTHFKKTYSPFKITSHIQNGMVIQHKTISARQPNSGARNCVKVQLKNRKFKRAYIPFCGGKSFIKPHDQVTIQSIGGGNKRAKGDLFGLNSQVIKVNGVSLKEKFLRKK